MRNLTLTAIEFDFSKGETFEFTSYPGRVVHAFTRVDRPSIIASASKKHLGTKSIGVALVEVDVTSPPAQVARAFVALAFGHVLTWPGEVEYFATFTDPQSGALITVYEVLSTDQAELARRQAAAPQP